VVFAIQLIATLVFFGTSLALKKKNRLFNYLTGFITAFAAISYYCMATGLSGVLVPTRGEHHAFREVLTARYYDWAVTTPLLLLDLALFAGLSGMDIVVLIVADLSMIVTGLLGALHPSVKYRFGLFAMSCAFLLFIIGTLVFTGYQDSKLRGDRVAKAYIVLAAFTIVLWSCYPIVWALGEGLNLIHADLEVGLYGLLDVLAKPGFGGLLLVFHSKISEAEYSLPDSFVESGTTGYHALPASD